MYVGSVEAAEAADGSKPNFPLDYLFDCILAIFWGVPQKAHGKVK